MQNTKSVSEPVLSDDTYREIRLSIATRLERSCSEWSREDFEALVDKITATTVKYMVARSPLSGSAHRARTPQKN